jgi:hypothetical protein
MKKYKNIIKLLVVVAFTLSALPACKKDYFDINTNPTAASDAGLKELLPSAEAGIALVVGNQFQIFGGMWAQYWTQSPGSSQYKTYEQYNPSADDFDRPWKILYADALQDLSVIIKKAAAESKPNYAACAKILQAYTFQILTDNFGDVPFSDALQAEAGVLSPKYDSQSDIYNGIIKLINDGLALIDENAAVLPGSEDILLNGDMAKWRKFAYTLKLKVCLRLSYVSPSRAQAGIATLPANSAAFLTANEDVKLNYLTQGGNTNPLYASIIDLNNVQDIVASETAVDYFNNFGDPRVATFYTALPGGVYSGIPQGQYTLPASTPVSKPSAYVGGNGSDPLSATAPVRLMSGYESLFLQAEAAARVWTGGNAKALYEEGIAASFRSAGITDDSMAIQYYNIEDTIPGFDPWADIKYPSSGTLENQIEAIITQKWLAMCGTQNDEAWIEWRRTDYPNYPNIFYQSDASLIGANRFPERFFYPSTEVTRNGAFPGQKLIYDKMWWDVN